MRQVTFSVVIQTCMIFFFLGIVTKSNAEMASDKINYSLERLDPHGSKQIPLTSEGVSNHKECSVCHKLEGLKITTETSPAKICLACHNARPHSGISEHKSEKINCLSCHSPHRIDSKQGDLGIGTFISKDAESEKGEFRFRSRPNSMIRKTCVDCHKW